MKPILLITLLPLAGVAAAVEYTTLLAAQSRTSFVYKQMNVPVEGEFKRFSGRIQFDPSKPAQGKAEIEMDLASIDTGSTEANDEVTGKLWFNTAAFPVARFVATAVKPLGNNRFEVSGKLSIKGKTLDTTAPVTFRQEGNHGIFEGGFVIKRADYGIGEGIWADFGAVANEVQIKFRVVAQAAGKK